MLFLSHLRAGTGAVCVETREESRLLNEMLAELGGTAEEFAVVAAPSGPVLGVRLVNGRHVKDKEPLIRQTPGQMSLAAAYEWASAAPGRVLIVLDWHMLANAPGHWRLLIDSLPLIRQPRGCGPDDPPGLVVFVAPTLTLETHNPLNGQIPVLSFDPPSREALKAVAQGIAGFPDEDTGETVVDALCGLSADTAEQVCAETIARGDGWVAESLRAARRQAIREGGLELWDSTAHLGGLGRFQSYVTDEVLPWIRDPQLAVRRILMAGVPGVGKSYAARWLAHKLSCECARISVPSLKAGIVGASEANLRRCLRTIDAMAKHSPLVVVVDEIDTIARDGLDGGTSSGMFAELLTWLQESQSQAIVVATLNHLEKLDPALESRFHASFFVELPGSAERQAVASIHLSRLGCKSVRRAASLIASLTAGYSSREIAEKICPSLARLSQRDPSDETVRLVIGRTTPVSRTQAAELEKMRHSAASLRKANDEDEATSADPSPSRRVMS
jgi:DNA polymerase III delta prime subunit